MDPTRPTCWVCGSGDVIPWKRRNLQRRLAPHDLQITDHRYGVTLGLCICRSCGFIFATDDEIHELTALYEGLADPEYEDSQDARALQMQWLLEKARRVHPQATTLLDVGAAAGLLVAHARQRGLDAVGVEPSRALVDVAPRLNGVELLHGVLPHPSLEGRRFDLVFLVDVLEHVADPVGLLTRCANTLNSTGMLVVITPDVGSLAAKVLRQRWWHFRVAHVGYFNRHSLATACERAGLATVERHRAKWFFRIGYLAERVAEYVPTQRINRLAEQVTALQALYRQVVPLNLYDSFALFLRHRQTLHTT